MTPDHCDHIAAFYRRKLIAYRAKRKPCPRIEDRAYAYAERSIGIY